MKNGYILQFFTATKFRSANFVLWYGRMTGETIMGLMLAHGMPTKPTARQVRQYRKAQKLRHKRWQEDHPI